MTSTISVLAIAVIVLIAVIWRLTSRQQSLPCPVLLLWLVEIDNPFTKTNRSAHNTKRTSVLKLCSRVGVRTRSRCPHKKQGKAQTRSNSQDSQVGTGGVLWLALMICLPGLHYRGNYGKLMILMQSLQ
jgi:hypothetical protein